MKYGIQNEPAAIACYEKKNNCQVKKCWLIIHKTIDYIGAFPDGLVGDDGLLEIKCASKLKTQDLERAIGEITDLDENGRLKKTDRHDLQVQGQLEITDRKWCDYVTYAANGIIHCDRIYRDNNFLETICRQ